MSETPPPDNENPFLRIYYEDAGGEEAPTIFLPGASDFPTERIPAAVPRAEVATERLPLATARPASPAPQRRRSSLLLLLLGLLLLILIGCGALAKTGLIFSGGANGVALLPTATPNQHLGDLLTVTPTLAPPTAVATAAPVGTITPTPMTTMTPTPTPMTTMTPTPTPMTTLTPTSTPSPAVLQVVESTAPYTCVANSYPNFTVSNAGGQTLNWSVSVSDLNITASPANGYVPKGNTASTVLISGTTDNNRFTLNFTSNGGTKSLSVQCG